MKGSEATGSTVRVSFTAPQHCSTSQVSQDTCGDPVAYYIVEWDTSDGFNSAALSSLVVDGEDILTQQQVPCGSYGRGNSFLCRRLYMESLFQGAL